MNITGRNEKTWWREDQMKRAKEDEETEDCGLFNDAFSRNERKE
jgi:hypothetical protein